MRKGEKRSVWLDSKPVFLSCSWTPDEGVLSIASQFCVSISISWSLTSIFRIVDCMGLISNERGRPLKLFKETLEHD